MTRLKLGPVFDDKIRPSSTRVDISRIPNAQRALGFKPPAKDYPQKELFYSRTSIFDVVVYAEILKSAREKWSRITKEVIARDRRINLAKSMPPFYREVQNQFQLYLENAEGIAPSLAVKNSEIKGQVGKRKPTTTHGLLGAVAIRILEELPRAKDLENGVAQVIETMRSVNQESLRKNKQMQFGFHHHNYDFTEGIEPKGEAMEKYKNSSTFATVVNAHIVFVTSNGAIQILPLPSPAQVKAMLDNDEDARSSFIPAQPLRYLSGEHMGFDAIKFDNYSQVSKFLNELEEGKHQERANNSGATDIHKILIKINFDYAKHLQDGRIKPLLNKAGLDGKDVWGNQIAEGQTNTIDEDRSVLPFEEFANRVRLQKDEPELSSLSKTNVVETRLLSTVNRFGLKSMIYSDGKNRLLVLEDKDSRGNQSHDSDYRYRMVVKKYNEIKGLQSPYEIVERMSEDLGLSELRTRNGSYWFGDQEEHRANYIEDLEGYYTLFDYVPRRIINDELEDNRFEMLAIKTVDISKLKAILAELYGAKEWNFNDNHLASSTITMPDENQVFRDIDAGTAIAISLYDSKAEMIIPDDESPVSSIEFLRWLSDYAVPKELLTTVSSWIAPPSMHKMNEVYPRTVLDVEELELACEIASRFKPSPRAKNDQLNAVKVQQFLETELNRKRASQSKAIG